MKEYLETFLIKDKKYNQSKLTGYGRYFFYQIYNYCPSLMKLLVFKDSSEIKRIKEVAKSLRKYHNLKGRALVEFIVFSFKVTDYIQGNVNPRITGSLQDPQENLHTYTDIMVSSRNIAFSMKKGG